MEQTLKQRIKAKGLEIKYVAQKVGIAKSTLSRILSGKQTGSEQTLSKINDFLSKIND